MFRYLEILQARLSYHIAGNFRERKFLRLTSIKTFYKLNFKAHRKFSWSIAMGWASEKGGVIVVHVSKKLSHLCSLLNFCNWVALSAVKWQYFDTIVLICHKKCFCSCQDYRISWSICYIVKTTCVCWRITCFWK